MNHNVWSRREKQPLCRVLRVLEIYLRVLDKTHKRIFDSNIDIFYNREVLDNVRNSHSVRKLNDVLVFYLCLMLVFDAIVPQCHIVALSL